MKITRRQFSNLCLAVPVAAAASQSSVASAVRHKNFLSAEAFERYFEHFRSIYAVPQIAGATTGAADRGLSAIPLFECSDPLVQQTYYYRWWTYLLHVVAAPTGHVVTEFLPAVPWAGRYNTISCAVGHHLYEGRWLRPASILDEYTAFWLTPDSGARSYSTWLADAVWNRFLVTGNHKALENSLPGLLVDYAAWEAKNRDANGLFWQLADRDGMEFSPGKWLEPAYRITINSYMFGNARAISSIAETLGKMDVAQKFAAKADAIRSNAHRSLWDESRNFFMQRERASRTLTTSRELNGYTPWYFDMANRRHDAAWKQFSDRLGFRAPWGLTTVEQRSPEFQIDYSGHECKWNGPSWPFATSVALTALARRINAGDRDRQLEADFTEAFEAYTFAHRIKDEHGGNVPWIDEDQDPYSGEWISRRMLRDRGDPLATRGAHYNHSTYNDIVISCVVGLRPNAAGALVVNPLIPRDWDYFCLDHVPWRGSNLSIVFDRHGTRYGVGAGLSVFRDGARTSFKMRSETAVA